MRYWCKKSRLAGGLFKVNATIRPQRDCSAIVLFACCQFLLAKSIALFRDASCLAIHEAFFHGTCPRAGGFLGNFDKTTLGEMRGSGVRSPTPALVYDPAAKAARTAAPKGSLFLGIVICLRLGVKKNG